MPSKPTTRRRAFPPAIKAKGRFRQYSFNGSLLTDTSADSSSLGRQVTVSEGHPFHSTKSGLADLGGDFFTQKSYFASSSKQVKLSRYKTFDNGQPIGSGLYEGSILPYLPTDSSGNVQFPPAVNSSNATLDKLGATAIARCAPGNSPASAATFLGELRTEGLPHLLGAATWKAKTDRLRGGSKDYLNYQFGWAPLVSDLRSLSNSVLHADSILAQYERDAGKVVRRHYQFPQTRSVEESVVASGVAARLFPATSYFSDTFQEKVTRTRITTRNQWFSGAFTYYLPIGYDSRLGMVEAARKAQHVVGLDLTPDTVWNLTPWSWAIDWFSNTGDVIKNLQRFATHGLVMRYGYVMEHTVTKDTYTISGSGLTTYPDLKIPNLILVTETKVRRRANPFGFGLTWDGLSSFQASILAALGLSRL